ncbi:thermonuclease family protein [uncultured Ruegeria sp.]|uniref:thermonuclease family protein n=1 Tax=uncultured Ruegeria sp. TaxID=259304 RepID=UPI0026265CF8|nr:thermonuclease family protein [uncultured Ruegeria sp.]
MKVPYIYRAHVTDVYDADTITVTVDQGFHSSMEKLKVRLFGINAPEVRGPERPEGLVSRDWLQEQILGKDIIMQTFKAGRGKGKYGRWLANIYRSEGDEISLNDEMINLGLAKAADY